MQQFDILDPKLDIFQSRFLEASAGTGKTFAIEHLVIRLLLESKEPIDLQQILAVTFTREAAHEMKARIRAKLESLLPEGDRRVREALINFDEIQVFTIHGFCHRCLSEFAFEAKGPLKLSSPDQPDHVAEMRQTVEDFFRTGDSALSPDVSALLQKMRFDLDRLILRIVDAMQKEEEPSSFSFPDLPPISESDLREDFFTLVPRYKRIKEEAFTSQLAPFHKLLIEKDREVLLQEKIWFFEKMHAGNEKLRAEPMEKVSLRAPGFFQLLHDKLVPHLEKARDPDEMIKRIAKECRSRWIVKAARSDQNTFDDLLHKMDAALDYPIFLEKVRAKYRAVIVDEFQDTDPIQWRIFKKLFLEKHLIYLVGDPKQSIYGFRSADIYTYMGAADALGQDAKAFLDTNFRSSPQLIDALNNLFTKFPEWISLPSLPKALQYHPVKAGRTENILEEAPIHYFGAKQELSRERSWPTKQMEEEKLFPFIAKEILRLKLEKSVPFSEIAILVKDRFQAQRVQLHLNLWKIPSAIKRTFNLAESRGFLAMEALLKATAQPENDSLARSVLYGPLMKEGENPFFSLRQLFQEKGFALFFAEFVAQHFQAHADPSLYLELRQTAEILMQQHNAGLEELLHLIQELKQGSPETDERLKLRGEEGEDHVRIMTTFASKGLEFVAVFALGMASRHFIQEEDEEKCAEKMRQLYVAFTRSREKLYIPILEDLSKKPVPPGTESPIELFFSKWETFAVEWVESISITPYQEKKEKVELIAPTKVEREFPVEYLTSFSSMAKPHGHTLLSERYRAQDLSIKTSHTLPLGAETGTVIHTIFETCFQDREAPLAQVVCEVLNGTHLEGWEEVIAEMVKETLQMPLIGDFSLDSLEPGEYFQEMEFLFPQGNQLIKGFADLVFKKGDQFYLVDWKTNWLGSSDTDYTDERLHQAMEEHDYYLQAKVYGEAIHRYVNRLYTNPEFGGAYYVFVRGKKAVHLGTC